MDILLSSFSLYRVQPQPGKKRVATAIRVTSELTHFVGLGPGCLCEVSNVDIVICPYFVFTDEGSEVLGGGVLVRVKPELDNLDHIFHAELLVLMSGHVELVNDLGELNKKCDIINNWVRINFMKLTGTSTPPIKTFLLVSMLLTHCDAQSSASLASSLSQVTSLMLDAAGTPTRDPVAIDRRCLVLRENNEEDLIRETKLTH